MAGCMAKLNDVIIVRQKDTIFNNYLGENRNKELLDELLKEE
jgi:hypothetical protein